MADGEGLLTAFHALLEIAAPERSDQALKAAIRVLVNDDRTRLGNRSPTVGAADLQRWDKLKPRLRQHLAATKIGMSVIAKATGLPLSTVQRSLSPNGPPPGRAIADLLERWLSDQNVKAPPKPAPAGNGSAVTKPSHDRQGPLPATKLDRGQADRLLAYLQLTDERQVRSELQMTAELARTAAAGGEVPAEAVERIAVFFDAS